MDFNDALSDLDRAVNSMQSVWAVVGEWRCKVVFTSIDLLQPWSVGGQSEIPTCELQILREDYLTARVVIGKTLVQIKNMTVRVLSQNDGLLGDKILLRCGAVDN